MTLQMPDAVPLSFEEVIERGRPVIDGILAGLADEVSEASTRPAFWHPTGFVVINLRDIPGLGLVRLHIWSKSRRNRREGNPDVHAHVFHLTSYVLAGEYFERQYLQHPSLDGDMYGYRVVPPNGDGIDRLVPDGVRYSLELTKTERSLEGSFHHLPAGVYHMTENPEGATCATIALISRPQPGRSDHLIGPEKHRGITSRRSVVSPSDLSLVLSEIGLFHVAVP